MNPLSTVSETVHATCVAIDGQGVLLLGRSGSGKSDLALRLLDRGARLISDDYTILRNVRGQLVATAPPSIVGKMEVRGIGIIQWDIDPETVVALCVTLDEPVERLPSEDAVGRIFVGISTPVMSIHALEASAPIKVEIAVRNLRNRGGDGVVR